MDFSGGRFTFIIRCDFSKIDISNTDKRRKGITLDAEVDFTSLGENWCILDVGFEGEEDIHLRYSYELSKQYK